MWPGLSQTSCVILVLVPGVFGAAWWGSRAENMRGDSVVSGRNLPWTLLSSGDNNDYCATTHVSCWRGVGGKQTHLRPILFVPFMIPSIKGGTNLSTLASIFCLYLCQVYHSSRQNDRTDKKESSSTLHHQCHSLHHWNLDCPAIRILVCRLWCSHTERSISISLVIGNGAV